MARLNLGDIIVRLGLDTAQFTREMRAAQRTLGGLGAGARQVGVGLTAAVTVPLVGAAAASLKFAADFDAAMTQSVAIMSEFTRASDLTAAQQEVLRGELEATARTIAKDLNLAAKDSAEAFFFLTSAGLTARQSIQALPQVAAFAKAGMFDFALATDLATDAQSALGLTVDDEITNLENLTRVTDVLVKANTLANATVQQFSVALTTKAGAALKVANKGIEEGVAVLAAFADQGVKAQNAGTALNIVLRELTTKGLKNAEAFEANNVAVFDGANNLRNMADIVGDLETTLDGMSDAQKKATLLQLGFTDKSVIFIQTLLGQSDAIREYQQALEEAGGTTQEVAEKQLEAFSEQLGLVQKRLIDAGITLGTAFIPIVLDLLDTLDPVIVMVTDAADAFAAWPQSMQVGVIALGAVAAAIGPLLIAFGFMAQGASALIAIWPAVVSGAVLLEGALVGVAAIAGWFAGSVLVELSDSLFRSGDATAEATREVGFFEAAWSILMSVVDFFVSIFEVAIGVINAGAEALGGWEPILSTIGAVAKIGLTPLLLVVEGIKLAIEATATVFFTLANALEGAAARFGLFGEKTEEGKVAVAGLNEEEQKLIGTLEAGAAGMDKIAESAERTAASQERSKQATEERIAAQRSAADAETIFAQALGISVETLQVVADRLGMSTEALILEKKAVQLTTKEVEKLNKERAQAEARLRGMVTTTLDAQKSANELAAAIALEGGAMALTTAETVRIAKQAAEWTSENVDLAKSIQDVVARANELEKAQNLAAIQAFANEMALNAQAASLGEVSDIGAETEAMFAALAEEEGNTAEAAHAAADAAGELGGGLSEADKEAIAAAESAQNIKDNLSDLGETLRTVGALFEAFGIDASSSLGQVLNASFQLADQLPQLAAEFKAGGFGVGGTIGQGDIGGTAQAGLAGVTGVLGATASGSTGARAGKGALAGASAGAQIGGPIGAAVGAAAGALVGLFRGRAMAKAQKEIEESVGSQVSEALANAIRDAAKELDISVGEAALLSLADVFAEVGFEAEGALADAQKSMTSLIGGIVDGTLPAKQATEELGEAFAVMASEIFEAGTVADAAMIQTVMNARAAGLEVPEIAAFVAEQLAQTAAGITSIIGAAFETEGGEMGFGGIQVATVEDAQAQATIFAAGFFATLEEQGLLAAVDAFGPAFAEMKAKFEQFGTDIDFGGVGRFFQLAQDPQFRPLLEGVQGLSDAMAGMANAGFLTADAFAAFQQQGASAFEQLTEAGLNQNEALQQMAPFLQNAIDTAERFGFPLDANTQKMIEQAEAAGIAFETDPMMRMVEVMEVIAMQLGATQEQLGLTGEAAVGAGESMAGAGQAAADAFGGAGAAASAAGSEASGAIGGMADDLSSAAEEASGSLTENFDEMALNVTDNFSTLQEEAASSLADIVGSSESTASAVTSVGQAAANAAGGFDQMAAAARRAADAAGSAARAGSNADRDGGNGERGAREMQHGGIVTRPTFTLLGEAGPEMVLPLSDLNETTRPEMMDLGGLGGGGADRGTQVIQLVLDRRVLFEVIEDGQRQGELRTHERSLQRFGD